jgi:hypothetical protein
MAREMHRPGELNDQRPLTDLIRWMNAQPRAPGAERYVWRHENARKQLELLGLRFIQEREGCKLYFRVSELREVAPILARAFLGMDVDAAHA